MSTLYGQERSSGVVILIGIVLLIASTSPWLSSPIRSAQLTTLTFQDRIWHSYTESLRRISSAVQVAPTYLDTLELEKHNRLLWSQLAETQMANDQLKRQLQATGSAQPRSSREGISSRLSYVRGEWILLSGSEQGIRSGDLVLAQGIATAQVTTVMSGYSTLVPLSFAKTAQLFMHDRSRELGFLETQRERVTITFTKQIEDLAIGDLISTVPDGAHTVESYPAYQVVALLSGAAESGSRVEVSALARMQVGLEVRIPRK